jgi:hypothetical protein
VIHLLTEFQKVSSGSVGGSLLMTSLFFGAVGCVVDVVVLAFVAITIDKSVTFQPDVDQESYQSLFIATSSLGGDLVGRSLPLIFDFLHTAMSDYRLPKALSYTIFHLSPLQYTTLFPFDLPAQYVNTHCYEDSA